MVGININAIFRGIALFLVAYLLFVIETPIIDEIEEAGVGMGHNMNFVATIQTLCDYFCLMLGLASVLYIVFAGLFTEVNIYERPPYF